MHNYIKKIPKLRFEGFSGEWEEKRLGDVVNFRNGKAHEQDISEHGKYVVVNSKFISTNGNVRKHSDKQISPLKKDDITIVMSDIPKGKAIGKCFLIDEDEKYTLNQRIGCIEPKKTISPFLFRILNRNNYFLKFDNGVSQTNLRKDEILKCPVVFPPLPEQQKIANFLEAVDKWIENLRSQKESLEAYKKGMMQKVFPGKGEKVPEIRFEGFDREWEEKRLGEVGRFVGGGTPSKNNENFWNGKIPWVSSSDISDGNFKTNITRFITKDAVKQSASKLIPKGSLLIVSRVGVGKIGIARIDLCTSQDFTNFLPSNIISTMFAAYLLNNKSKRLLSFSQGTSIKGFTKDDLTNLKLNIPTLPEQQKIANFLSSIDKLIEAKQEQIYKAEEWKKGLMQEMFV